MPECLNENCKRVVYSLDALCPYCGMDNHWFLITGSKVFYVMRVPVKSKKRKSK